MPTKLEVKGLNEARQSLENVANELHGDEMMSGMYQAIHILTADARRFSPVDTGRLRASISGTVAKVGFPMKRIQGIVGTNIEYAPFMEDGTGVFAGNPPVRMPPPEALAGWARRHNKSAFLIAQAIFLRGGLRPRKFMAQSLKKNQDRVVQIIGDRVRLIIQRS